MVKKEMINPRVDIAFKKIFGVEDNKDLLISLINSIVGERDQVDEVEVLNPYNEKNFEKDKLSIMDIKARNKHSKQLFNIEMQISNEASYDKRALYNWSKVYAGQLGESGKYQQLKKTIGIHILNFSSVTDKLIKTLSKEDRVLYDNRYHYQFNMREKEIPFNYFDEIELHVIELSSFEGKENDEFALFLPKVKNALDRWATFLTKQNLINPEHIPEELNSPEIKKAVDVLSVMSLNTLEREAYENHLSWLRIQVDTIDKVEKEAEERGIEKGMEKGIEKGIEQGLEQGIKQGVITRNQEIARNLLSEGMEIKSIVKITGLSEEEIRKL